jgi:hypothetical protein
MDNKIIDPNNDYQKSDPDFRRKTRCKRPVGDDVCNGILTVRQHQAQCFACGRIYKVVFEDRPEEEDIK